jgi:non-specific serine/threonine protein kinase
MLPAPLTPLIGRQRELRLADRLDPHANERLFTITGPGGVGKTRLALQIAAELVDRFDDGVYFVDLAPVVDPGVVASTIVQTLGILQSGTQPVEETLARYLRERELLLLDNFEQVLDAAPVVSRLLSVCPRLRVLVTSRAPLHIRGEHEAPLDPLPPPPAVRSERDLRPLSDYAAVALFVERAREARPDFQITDANAASVAEICRRLDGLPLALELAAARIRVLPPQALLDRLERRLPTLVGGPRDAPARQQTLRNAIAWSYELLTPDDQRLYRQLSVFAGGWTLEAAEQVCDADLDALSGIERLIDHSLVRQHEQPGGSARFGMLETIREFAFEQMCERGDSPAVQQRHAAYYVAFAEAERPRQATRERRASMERLETEHPNLRTALHWLLEQGQIELALRLGVAIGEFWQRHGHVQEGSDWIERLLLNGRDAPPGLLFELHLRAFGLAASRFDRQRAREMVDALQRGAAMLGDHFAIGRALIQASGAAMSMDRDYVKWCALAEEALEHCRASGDRHWIARALTNLGTCYAEMGDAERATMALEEGLTRFQEIGDSWWIAMTVDSLGHVARKLADFPIALERYQQSLAVMREQGDPDGIRWELICIAQTLLAAGRVTDAVRLLGAAEAIAASLGVDEHPRGYEQTVATARGLLGEVSYAAAFGTGRTYTFDDAVEEALAITPASVAQPPTSTPPQLPARLSPRELEVLRLVADGLTDAEVAESLFMARRTVNTHLTSIYTKLGVSSRSAATRWAVEHGLT